MTRSYFKRDPKTGKMVRVGATAPAKPSKPASEPAPMPADVDTSLSDEVRAKIFAEIDSMTVAKATAAISKVTDEELLRLLGSDANYKGTRTAADDRLQALRED